MLGREGQDGEHSNHRHRVQHQDTVSDGTDLQIPLTRSTSLPDELLTRVFHHLPIKTLFRKISRVSKHWKEIVYYLHDKDGLVPLQIDIKVRDVYMLREQLDRKRGIEEVVFRNFVFPQAIDDSVAYMKRGIRVLGWMRIWITSPSFFTRGSLVTMDTLLSDAVNASKRLRYISSTRIRPFTSLVHPFDSIGTEGLTDLQTQTHVRRITDSIQHFQPVSIYLSDEDVRSWDAHGGLQVPTITHASLEGSVDMPRNSGMISFLPIFTSFPNIRSISILKYSFPNNITLLSEKIRTIPLSQRQNILSLHMDDGSFRQDNHQLPHAQTLALSFAGLFPTLEDLGVIYICDTMWESVQPSSLHAIRRIILGFNRESLPIVMHSTVLTTTVSAFQTHLPLLEVATIIIDDDDRGYRFIDNTNIAGWTYFLNGIAAERIVLRYRRAHYNKVGETNRRFRSVVESIGKELEIRTEEAWYEK